MRKYGGGIESGLFTGKEDFSKVKYKYIGKSLAKGAVTYAPYAYDLYDATTAGFQHKFYKAGKALHRFGKRFFPYEKKKSTNWRAKNKFYGYEQPRNYRTNYKARNYGNRRKRYQKRRWIPYWQWKKQQERSYARKSSRGITKYRKHSSY